MHVPSEHYVALPVDVTVVVPVHNVEGFISDTLQSILQQSLTSLEVIVVDDASTDRTVAVVERFAHMDPRVRLIRKPTNQGVSRARNDALDLARGRWVAFVDGDDWIAAHRLARMVELGDATDADWVADDQFVVTAPGEPPLHQVLHGEPVGACVIEPAHLIDRDPPERIGYGTLKPLVRNAFLQAQGLHFRPDFDRGEDFAFHVVCGLRGGTMVLLNEPLYLYRRRSGSLADGNAAAVLTGMLRQNAVLLAEATGCGDERVIAALRRREAKICAALQYRSLVDYMRHARFIKLGAALLKKPGLAFRLLEGLSRAAGRRVGLRS